MKSGGAKICSLSEREGVTGVGRPLLLEKEALDWVAKGGFGIVRATGEMDWAA